jgi:hypothetical protein
VVDFRGFDADLACAYALRLPVDGLWTDHRGTKAFRCIIPGHTDRTPSASLYRTDSGDILYRDWHGAEAWYTLPEVRASWAYGSPVKFKGRAPEHMIWRLRLLMEGGVLKPCDVPHRLLPSDAYPPTNALYQGFLLLLGLKWRYGYGDPTTFSWRFATAWCGLSKRLVKDSLGWLFRNNYIHSVGKHRSKFGKESLLYLPVPPASEAGSAQS